MRQAAYSKHFCLCLGAHQKCLLGLGGRLHIDIAAMQQAMVGMSADMVHGQFLAGQQMFVGADTSAMHPSIHSVRRSSSCFAGMPFSKMYTGTPRVDT